MTRICLAIRLAMIAIVMDLRAQETHQQSGLDAEALKKANNPMANTKAISLHNYFVSSQYGIEDATFNQLLFRYAQPIGHVLLRATLPVITSSQPGKAPLTGFGDFNVFAIYTPPTTTGNQFGIGPLITAPTGTKELGQGKWQAGLAAVAFFAKSHIVQMGMLLQWQASFAGDEDKPDVNMLTPQIFVICQIGGGTYIRSSGIWTFDLTNGHYCIPLGLGLGKVAKVGGAVLNFFAEPQLSVAAGGTGQSKFQTFFGINTQF